MLLGLGVHQRVEVDRIEEEEHLVERSLAVEAVEDSPIAVGEEVEVVGTYKVEETRRCGFI